VIAVLLTPYVPETAAKLLAALGHEDTALAGAEYGLAPGGARVERLAPLFPKLQDQS
jgi:methionyl-tRNA synthetase